MILECPRAKQGLCHTKHGGAGGIILWALITVFLVFDIEKAYDIFLKYGILKDIQNIVLKGQLPNFIQNI